MKRPIAISLSPNTESDDVLLALKLLLQPIKWFDVRQVEKLEKEFADYFGKGYHALAVNCGRSAEYLILKALDIKPGDEVAIQALTCVAVANPILWNGAKPIYVDVDESFNIDAVDLKKKLTVNTKTVIIQHAFGIPADVEKIKKVVKSARTKFGHQIKLIEDCAVSLGAKYKKKLTGIHADIAFFSFGRDKVISSVFGGMILCKNKRMYESLLRQRDRLAYPSPFWFFQQIIHPIAFSLILPFYNVGIGKFSLGKIMLVCLQKLRLLSKAVYEQEKVGMMPAYIPKKMPGGLAALARNQLKKLDGYNKKRVKAADFYFKKLKNLKLKMPIQRKGAIWLRFPLLTKNPKEIFNCMKAKGILIGDWYKAAVYPVKYNFSAGYKKGSCPKAEEYAKSIINLPTYPLLEEANLKKIVSELAKCISTQQLK